MQAMHASIPNHRALRGNGAHDESESEEAAAAAAAVAVASSAVAAAVVAAAGGCDPPAELFVRTESTVGPLARQEPLTEEADVDLTNTCDAVMHPL